MGREEEGRCGPGGGGEDVGREEEGKMWEGRLWQGSESGEDQEWRSGAWRRRQGEPIQAVRANTNITGTTHAHAHAHAHACISAPPLTFPPLPPLPLLPHPPSPPPHTHTHLSAASSLSSASRSSCRQPACQIRPAWQWSRPAASQNASQLPRSCPQLLEGAAAGGVVKAGVGGGAEPLVLVGPEAVAAPATPPSRRLPVRPAAPAGAVSDCTVDGWGGVEAVVLWLVPFGCEAGAAGGWGWGWG